MSKRVSNRVSKKKKRKTCELYIIRILILIINIMFCRFDVDENNKFFCWSIRRESAKCVKYDMMYVCTQQNVLKSQRKTIENVFNFFFFCRLYRYLVIVYERYDRIFWDIRQRYRRGPPWRISHSTLMANVTDYSNMMSPSFSVMCHFFVYFLLTLLNKYLYVYTGKET